MLLTPGSILELAMRRCVHCRTLNYFFSLDGGGGQTVYSLWWPSLMKDCKQSPKTDSLRRYGTYCFVFFFRYGSFALRICLQRDFFLHGYSRCEYVQMVQTYQSNAHDGKNTSQPEQTLFSSVIFSLSPRICFDSLQYKNKESMVRQTRWVWSPNPERKAILKLNPSVWSLLLLSNWNGWKD